MQIKKTLILTLTILILLLNIQTTSQPIKKQNTKIIYINNSNTNGPWDGTIDHPYKTINDGIQNATQGDAIYIFNGTYHENIVINKRLSLIGEGNTVLDGGYKEYVIHITGSGVVLKDLIIRNSGGFKGNTAILVESDNNLIIDCEIYRARTGLTIRNSCGNEIKNTIFYSNGEGIKTEKICNTYIEGCCFYHNAFGCNIQHSRNILITDCYAHTNGVGLHLNDSMDINVSKCAIYNNNDNQGGMLVYFCKNITIYNCNFEHNGFGITIGDCSDIYILYSDFLLMNHEAFWFATKSENLNIQNCEIYDNIRFGLILSSGSCKIRYSNLYNNLVGVSVSKSHCDARKNWWGSPLGPALFEWKHRDKILSKFGIVNFIPWLSKKNSNAGSNWEINYDKYPMKNNITRFKQIELPGNDTDNDGLPDWWEEKWGYNPNTWDDHANLDPDEDALNNFEECYTDQWGSNPFKKDLFIEVDWFESEYGDINSNKPRRSWIDKMVKKFSEHDITLHFDDGRLGGGESIPYIKDFYYEDLDDIYWNYFLHNDLNNPRKGIFHYCIISDFGPYHGFAGFSIFGWNHLDSWVISAERIKQNHPFIKKDYIIISVIFHELGHTLGLLADDHDGIDNMVATMPFTKQFFKYSTYRSCMNYLYTYRIFDYSDGSHGRNDFDDWSSLDFGFFKNTHFELPKT